MAQILLLSKRDNAPSEALFSIGQRAANDFLDNSGLRIGVVLNALPAFQAQHLLRVRVEVGIGSADAQPIIFGDGYLSCGRRRFSHETQLRSAASGPARAMIFAKSRRASEIREIPSRFSASAPWSQIPYIEYLEGCKYSRFAIALWCGSGQSWMGCSFIDGMQFIQEAKQ